MRKTLQLTERWKDLALSKTWVELLQDAAKSWPAKEAIVFEDQRVTYAQYNKEAQRAAKGLYRLGVRRGDHVALWMTNRPEWCFCRFGIYMLGAVMIPVNTRFRTEELSYILKQGDVKALVMGKMFLDKIDAMAIIKSLIPELEECEPGRLQSSSFPGLCSVICLDGKEDSCISWADMLAGGEDIESVEEIQPKLYPDDIIHIIYTSGTTDFPKGVMTLNSNNIAFTAVTAEAFKMEEHSRYLNLPPFFGNIGLWSQNMSILTGATLVTANRFTPVETMRLIEAERITHTMFVPTMLGDILSHPDLDGCDLDSLRYIHCGGAVLPRKYIITAKEKFGIKINNAYGLVEASGLNTWVPIGDTDDHVEQTIGVALPHCEVTIRDPITSRELEPGLQGEICMKETFPGSCHMKGYYGREDLTAQAVRGEWLHSGDLGIMDEEGYFRITGRVKEMFNVGGFNVSPPEIEALLLKHHKVQSAFVVGVPDDRLGEIGAAYIRLIEGAHAAEEEIIEFCKQGLANVKVPKYVFFVDEFPLTAQGKVQKFKLREQFINSKGIGSKLT